MSAITSVITSKCLSAIALKQTATGEGESSIQKSVKQSLAVEEPRQNSVACREAPKGQRTLDH